LLVRHLIIVGEKLEPYWMEACQLSLEPFH
jgi:hypothetical protein